MCTQTVTLRAPHQTSTKSKHITQAIQLDLESNPLVILLQPVPSKSMLKPPRFQIPEPMPESIPVHDAGEYSMLLRH